MGQIKVVNLCFAAVAFALFQMMSGAAEARSWKPLPRMLARDYLVIVDQRSQQEMVMVMWFSPMMIPDTPQTKQAREALSKFFVVGVSHANFSTGGTMSFRNSAPPVLKVGSSPDRQYLEEAKLEPSMIGMVKVLQTVLQRSFGPAGENMHWFIFDGRAIDSCGKGVVALKFAGETYTYKTPIPGCP